MPEPRLPQQLFIVYESGAQHVPLVQTRSKAKLVLRFNKSFSKCRYELRVKRAHDVTQAHLHLASAGEDGEIIAFLLKPEQPFHGYVSGKLTAHNLLGGVRTIAELYQLIRDGQVFTDVHSVQHETGLVRGQIFTNL